MIAALFKQILQGLGMSLPITYFSGQFKELQPMNRRRCTRWAAGLLIGFGWSFLPALCLGTQLTVVASIFPVADLVSQVGGGRVTVTTLMPPGASPHTFEPKPSLVRKIAAARIFFMIGAGLEFWARDFIRSSGTQIQTVELSAGMPLIGLGHHAEAAEAGHHPPAADEARFANPHVWLDPLLAVTMVRRIEAALKAADPPAAERYAARTRAYIGDLERLHREIEATIARFDRRQYVAFHPAWDYFARRYGLEPVGIIETAPGSQPNPRQIGNIVAQIQTHGLQAIFAEPQLNLRIAEIIARQAGVRLLILDPIGGKGLPGRGTYIDLMRYNLKIFQEALQ
jgi:zinc transport system substrate-binding protein